MISLGDPAACVREIKSLVWPGGCTPGAACAVDGVAHPPLRHQFYGMSVYFFALDCVKHFLGDQGLPNW